MGVRRRPSRDTIAKTTRELTPAQVLDPATPQMRVSTTVPLAGAMKMAQQLRPYFSSADVVLKVARDSDGIEIVGRHDAVVSVLFFGSSTDRRCVQAPDLR